MSALAVDGDGLLALTDSAVAIRFAKPGRVAGQRFERPVGPGRRQYKDNGPRPLRTLLVALDAPEKLGG